MYKSKKINNKHMKRKEAGISLVPSSKSQRVESKKTSYTPFIKRSALQLEKTKLPPNIFVCNRFDGTCNQPKQQVVVPGLPNIYYQTLEDCKKACTALPTDIRDYIADFLLLPQFRLPFSKKTLRSITPQYESRYLKQLNANKDLIQKVLPEYPQELPLSLVDGLYQVLTMPYVDLFLMESEPALQIRYKLETRQDRFPPPLSEWILSKISPKVRKDVDPAILAPYFKNAANELFQYDKSRLPYFGNTVIAYSRLSQQEAWMNELWKKILEEDDLYIATLLHESLPPPKLSQMYYPSFLNKESAVIPYLISNDPRWTDIFLKFTDVSEEYLKLVFLAMLKQKDLMLESQDYPFRFLSLFDRLYSPKNLPLLKNYLIQLEDKYGKKKIENFINALIDVSPQQWLPFVTEEMHPKVDLDRVTSEQTLELLHDAKGKIILNPYRMHYKAPFNSEILSKAYSLGMIERSELEKLFVRKMNPRYCVNALNVADVLNDEKLREYYASEGCSKSMKPSEFPLFNEYGERPDLTQQGYTPPSQQVLSELD
jgi:hypothetical protein